MVFRPPDTSNGSTAPLNGLPKSEDVFISYKHEQLTIFFIEALQNRLREGGFSWWRDKDNIRVGAQWSDEIDKALRSCRAVITIITPAATLSQYVTYEWCFALGVGKPILPVLLAGEDIHVKLQQFEYIDFRGLNTPNWGRLLDTLRQVIDESGVRAAERQRVHEEMTPVQDVGESLVEAIADLTASAAPNAIDAIDMINLLMKHRVINHQQQARAAKYLLAHRARGG